jgi:hypothetical protein
MGNERRFARVPCNEKVTLRYDGAYMGGRLRNISVNGALVQLNEEMSMQLGEQCLITICMKTFDINLHFLAEIRHSHNNEVGVVFLFIDSDTKSYLKSLLAFRTANPYLIAEEFDYPPYRDGNSGCGT